MSAVVETWLTAQAAADPATAHHFTEMHDLYQRRLWHQLTMKLETIVGLPEFQTGDRLVSLYHNFIVDFEHAISPLKLGHLAVAVSSRYTDRAAASVFMQNVIEKLVEFKQPGFNEPVLYLKMHVALLSVHSGELKSARAMITGPGGGSAQLDTMPSPDPSVAASYHYVASQYHKAMQEFSEFYKQGLLYLAHVPVESLPEETKKDLAVDLSLAALLGEDVYNFAELIAHPIVRSLAGTPFDWLLDLLNAFNAGDLFAYDALCLAKADALNAQPALVAHERKLREKITITCLLQIVFSASADCREIALSDIAEKTKLTTDGVEYLLMKALSVKLIEGVIDNVNQKVNVTWVTPRVLLIPQITQLANRLDGWINKVKTTSDNLSEEVPQLAAVA
jgi:26S proteasome regulatory subunit N9